MCLVLEKDGHHLLLLYYYYKQCEPSHLFVLCAFANCALLAESIVALYKCKLKVWVVRAFPPRLSV